MQAMQGCDDGDTKCSAFAKDDAVLVSHLLEIDTPVELAEFQSKLADDELFQHVKGYLRASRAELLDLWPLAIVAGGLGVAMFVAWTNLAAQAAAAADDAAAGD